MKMRLMMVSLIAGLVTSQVSLVYADGLVDMNPIPELAELEKQAQAQEEKAKAFAEEMAKKKADQTTDTAKAEAPKSSDTDKSESVKSESKISRVETIVSKTEPQPETKTFTTTAGNTTIINNATGPQSVVVNVNPEPVAKPKKVVVKKKTTAKPEEPVDTWTAQERQYSYP